MQDYLHIGSEAMKSVMEYNSLLKSIEFELKISGGWLKPIRLKQLTGVLAQDRLEKQYEETKKKNRNFILRSKIQPDFTSHEDWRMYFSEEELKDAYKRIELGEDEVENDTSGSESEPSLDNIIEVEIIQTKEEIPIKEVIQIKEERSIIHKPIIHEGYSSPRPEGILSHSINSSLNQSKRPPPKKKTRKSEQAFYPHTSRSVLNKADESIRTQTSSKVFSHRESRSGRNTPGLSPMIFNTFRKNLGFYQQMLTTKSKIAHGSLEIMCTKLVTTKNPKYNK